MNQSLIIISRKNIYFFISELSLIRLRTLWSPLFAQVSRSFVLSGGTQRCALSTRQKFSQYSFDSLILYYINIRKKLNENKTNFIKAFYNPYWITYENKQTLNAVLSLTFQYNLTSDIFRNISRNRLTCFHNKINVGIEMNSKMIWTWDVCNISSA